MEVHPSQRRVSCEICRKSKAKCQRIQPGDAKCVRCTINNVICDSGQQKKVGRPKRKEPASPSGVENPLVTKRPKPSSNSKSRTTAAQTSNAQRQLFIHNVPGIFDIHGASAPIYSGDGANQLYTSNKSVISSTNPSPPTQEWLGWPTFMTDHWRHKVMRGAARSSDIADLESGSLFDTQAIDTIVPLLTHTPSRFAYEYSKLLPGLMDQTIFQGSLSWIDPGFRASNDSFSDHRLVKRKARLPFGMGRQPAYYIHENQFSSNPGDMVPVDLAAHGSNIMVRLTSIVHGLRLRSTLVQSNRSRMTLSLLIHRQGPLFIGGYSPAEYIMSSAQELVQIVAQSAHRAKDQQLPDGFISTITDIYTRLLSFFELYLEHLTDRAERMGAEPVVPILGLMYNSRVITGPCTQGTLFTSAVFYLLERLDHVLGLDSKSRNGLLSADQIDVLCNKLDGSDDLSQNKGIMRPADMRRLYAQVSTVLERISANE